MQERSNEGRNIPRRYLVSLEYWLVYWGGKLFGIRFVVRYLRNPNHQVTVRLLKAYGASIGEATTFRGSVLLDNVTEDQHATGDFSHLSIDANCFIGDGVYFDLADKIIIHANVMISGHCSLVTHADCGRSRILSADFPRVCRPIEIFHDSWLGFGATLMAGTSVGPRAVVGAEGLVTHQLEADALFVGVPAKRVRRLHNLTDPSDHV